MVVPPNGWFILENRIKMDGLGVALFQEPLYDVGIHRQWLCVKTSVELGVAKSIYSLWSSFGHGFIRGTGWGGWLGCWFSFHGSMGKNEGDLNHGLIGGLPDFQTKRIDHSSSSQDPSQCTCASCQNAHDARGCPRGDNGGNFWVSCTSLNSWPIIAIVNPPIILWWSNMISSHK